MTSARFERDSGKKLCLHHLCPAKGMGKSVEGQGCNVS